VYTPPSFAEDRLEILFDFIEAHPLAALVTSGADGMLATHLPLVLDRSGGPYGTLRGHIARANPHHRQRPPEPESLVIFTGPDAYITPAWYAAKAEHGKVVPTWNYVAVHAYGTVRYVEDRVFLGAHLQALTTRHERDREHPWAIEDAPEEYIRQLEKAIVGVEVVITRLEGKWKMSQNRPVADIDGVVQGLSSSPRPADQEVARVVEARRSGSTRSS
jgi:transcriptional regulator